MNSTPNRSSKAPSRRRTEPQHPHGVSVLTPEEMPAQPFSEGVEDELDPELRHRLISDVAYQRYVERGYADGYDLDDWLQAESDVDHMMVGPHSG